jgi:hypothetical protein
VKGFLVSLCLFLAIVVGGQVGAEMTSVEQAKEDLQSGKYHQGLKRLIQAQQNRSLPVKDRAQALLLLARFYEKDVGDTTKAELFYTKVKQLPLGDDDSLFAQADNGLAQLRQLATRFAAQNQILNAIRSSSVSSAQRAQNNSDRLKSFIQENPEYYRLGEVYYTLGSISLQLEQFGQATKWLKKAQAERQAIHLHLPIRQKMKIAQEKYWHILVTRLAWGSLGVILLLAMLFFYTSRPWRFVGWRHLAAGLVIVGVWWGGFLLLQTVIGASFFVPEGTLRLLNMELPFLVYTQADKPGSGILATFFYYGLVGFLGSWVLAIGARIIPRRWIAATVTTCLSFCLFSALITVFYLRHCESQSLYLPQSNSVRTFITGANYFKNFDLEPYILTNPQDYPLHQLVDYMEDNAGDFGKEDSDLIHWLKEQAHIQASSKRLSEQGKRQ